MATPLAAAPARSTDPAGAAWIDLVARLSGALDRGGREWTAARRKTSLQRVLAGGRSDPQRTLQRLQSLVASWDSDRPAEAAALAGGDRPGQPHPDAQPPAEPPAQDVAPPSPLAVPGPAEAWPAIVGALQATVCAALPAAEPTASALADRLAGLARALQDQGPTPALAAAVGEVCVQARGLLGQRHHLLDELTQLARELAGGLAELAEDDSWAQGQCQALQQRLAAPPTPHQVRASAALLAQTRRHQHTLRSERRAAQDALKQLIGRMLSEVGDLGDHTGRFQQAMARHAAAVAAADSLAGLAGVVRQLLDDSRAVQQAVADSRGRLQDDRARAQELQTRVLALESELRRLSDEVATDALTQVANRRGLAQAFTRLAAQAQRAHDAPPGSGSTVPGGGEAATLAVALLDIDNFKRLNDSLGHGAGDQALKSLAAAVRERLRPGDELARYGGEEFVVLLPGTAAVEAQQVLTRLQRALSASLFLHEGREVFVTFSAGVTAWRPGEALDVALERADCALYEAKRTGKNRSCLA